MSLTIQLFKATVCNLSSLSPSLFEMCNCSHMQNFKLYLICSLTQHSEDEHIEQSVQLSITSPVSILAFRTIDYSLWKYD